MCCTQAKLALPAGGAPYFQRLSPAKRSPHALERRVVALDAGHRLVHELADGGLLGLRLQVLPTRPGRDPEDVVGAVLVGILGVGALRAFGLELPVLFIEGVGDVLEEDEAEDDVLVLGGVHRAAQRVGHSPELGFEAQACPGPRSGIGGGVTSFCRRLYPVPAGRMSGIDHYSLSPS
jgi:hypothetical protein